MAGTTQYKNKWAADNLDQLRITVPKGKRSELDAYAKMIGYKGYADYIKAVISADSGIQLVRIKSCEKAGQSTPIEASEPTTPIIEPLYTDEGRKRADDEIARYLDSVGVKNLPSEEQQRVMFEAIDMYEKLLASYHQEDNSPCVSYCETDNAGSEDGTAVED